MDKKYQDIHYRDIHEQDVFVHRKVTIHNINFKENCIEITFTDYDVFPTRTIPIRSKYTLIIPKLTGYSLIID